ncbi:HAD-IA family hydrolase [Porphyromonadaceae sp. NP-X]|jgi:HAD superfamily hydrolase (TIGR01509 family)|nr:HAD-IA family hydrolase [Paludibacteraceae bacterium]MDS1031910.1 HAD-IA family hydrolase [Porphyromonadaceae sp. NP-X]
MFKEAIQNYLQQHNYMSFHPKAVFFDMDGVLINSMKNHSRAWMQAMKESNLPFTEEDAYMHEGCIGTTTINDTFLKHLNREATEEEQKKIYSAKSSIFESLEPIEKMPFAYELLKKLKSEEIKIYVVTGSGQPKLINSLNTLFPEIFTKETMITGFDVKEGKPSPEPYLLSLKRSGFQPWETVVVENAPMGILSASKAGLFTLAVNTGPFDDDFLYSYGADLVLDSMEHLYNEWDNFRKSWF